MRSSAEIEFRLRASPSELPELMDGDCSYEDSVAACAAWSK